MIALSSNVLGEGYSSSSGPWCWIKDCKDIKDITKFSPVTWMAITGKFWEVLTYLGIFAIYLVLMWLKLQRYCRSRKVRTILLRSSKLAFNVQVKTLSLSVVVVVNFSHFNLLLQNKSLKLKTIHKCFFCALIKVRY